MTALASPQPSSRSPLPRAVAAAASITLIALLGACATEPAPKAAMAVGQAAVDKATGPAGAEAPMELAAARDKIARAQVAYANKDYALARQLAEQAEADAALAEAKARNVRSDQALTAVRDSIRQLREEMARRG